jgi:mono/diheme cytochrome c family protein
MLSVLKNNVKKTFLFSFLIAIITLGCRFYFKTTTDQFTAKTTPASLERGKNLVFNICGGCHYDQEIKKFIGRPLNDLPKIAGKMYSANLTHSLSNGIPPHYSDAELFYLLKTGISKNGKFMPYMMRPMMADEDINDIISFLRSDDPAVAAADTTVGKTHINLIGRIGIRVAAKPQPYNKGVTRPNENDPLEQGKYLVALIGCYHCHSKKVLGLNYLEPEKSKGYLQGGITLKDPEGKKLWGPNLTPDKETGIGNYTKEDFRKAITEGITPSGRKLSPPMPRLSHLTVTQIEALYTYLKSRPAVHHTVKRRSS